MRKFLTVSVLAAVPAAVIAAGVYVQTLPMQSLSQVLGG